MLSRLTQEIYVCALPDGDSNEVFMTDIVSCAFNWASDVAVSRCRIPFHWFVKQIMIILWYQIPDWRKLQATPWSESFAHINWLWSALKWWAAPHLHICFAGPIYHTTVNGHTFVLHESDTVIAYSSSSIPEMKFQEFAHLIFVCEWSDAGVASSSVISLWVKMMEDSSVGFISQSVITNRS